MNRNGVLAIDAGQSGIKVRVDTRDGRGELTFPGILTAQPLLPQLAQVVTSSISRTGAVVHTVTAGVSGLTSRNADADTLLRLVEGDGISSVSLAHDSVTSFLGALGDQRGAVIAAGTGAVTLAVGDRDTARVDGWGWTMGDAGSGFWIGREALTAVMRAHDHRGPVTTLTDAVQDRWPDLAEAYIHLQADQDRVRMIASFAHDVAIAAEAGDVVAQSITEHAAEQLAHSVRTAAKRVTDNDTTLSVCAIGGVFASVRLRDSFERSLAKDSMFQLQAPLGAGIDGSGALAHLSPTHPLAGHVQRAIRPTLATETLQHADHNLPSEFRLYPEPASITF